MNKKLNLITFVFAAVSLLFVLVPVQAIPNFVYCSQMGGTICSPSQYCNGYWIHADDSSYCCIGNCYTPSTSTSTSTTTTCHTTTTSTTTTVYETCVPGTTRDRSCACPSQVGYYRCNMWGTGWDYIVENCPSGYTCSGGQCVPSTTTTYYTSTTSTTTSTTTTTYYCNPMYLDVWQCSGNWRQREYQNSDCSIVWQNYDYCSNGCSGNQCWQCSSQSLDNYQCSGNWRQRQYQYSDCSVAWLNYEFCTNGCSGGSCITQQQCQVSGSVTTPGDVYLGNTIYTTVSFYNSGDFGGNVRFTAYVCRQDGSNCQAMNCNTCQTNNCYGCQSNNCNGCASTNCNGNVDPTIYVDGHTSRSVTCSLIANEVSSHEIKVVWCGCNLDPTIYSGSFEIMSKPGCSEGYLNNFQCSGGWKQQLYQFSDCRTEWRNAQYCSYSCSDGQCAEPPKIGKPDISIEPEYTVQKCERNKFTFQVTNTGEGRDDFAISFSGSAAGWVRSASTVSLDSGETRIINAYVSVPCSAEGDYDLTVSVTDGAKDTASTMLTVQERSLFPMTGWFINWPSWSSLILYGILILLIIGIILVLLFLLVWGLPKGKQGRKQEGGPESFRNKNGNNSRTVIYVKAKPESFLERECHRH